MLNKNNEMLIACAKVICKKRQQGEIFFNLGEVKEYVRNNKQLLLEAVERYGQITQ